MKVERAIEPEAVVGGHSGPMLVAEAIDVRRGSDGVVRAFTLTHEPGTIVWLVGPNGAGKSSLLRVLAGFEEPAAGRVVRMPREDGSNRIGYYHPAMGLPPEARARAFTRLAEALAPGVKPLEPERLLGRKRCGNLSTGEQKRLLLGAILAAEPAFLLLDEPYEHLSDEGRAELTETLYRLARRFVVVVSTNQELRADVVGPIIRLSVREGDAQS